MPQIYKAIRPMFKTDRWRICLDDMVYILSGPDKGKTGRVLQLIKDDRLPQVIVEGRNMRKKKVRVGLKDDDFFVVTMEAPLHYSQVQVINPATGRHGRVVFMYTAEGERVRVHKGIEAPTAADILQGGKEEDADPRAGLVGKKDTPADDAKRATHQPQLGFPFRVAALERVWAGMHPEPAEGEEAEEVAAAEGRAGRAIGGGSAGGLVPALGGVRRIGTAAAACAGGAGAAGVAHSLRPLLARSFAASGLLHALPARRR